MTEQRDARDQAVEYLQVAALEAIRAWRTFLDVAEQVVREPETAAAVGKAFAEAAASVLRPAHAQDEDEAGHEEQDTGAAAGRVRHIDVD
jgi:hypothetical protein